MGKEYVELNSLPDSDEFINGDLKVLEDMSWRRAAHHIWYDAVKRNDQRHSLKWAGMFSARALHRIEEDSRRLKQLTWALMGLTVVLCILTGILSWDACSKWDSDHQKEHISVSSVVTPIR